VTSRRPRVVTIVLNYQYPDDTLEAVASVQAGDFLDAAVVVVDNGPDGDEHARLRAGLDPCVGLLPTGANLGYAGGNNAGIRFALDRYDPELIWLLNPDTVADPSALGVLVATMQEHPEAALVGSRLVDADGATVLYDGAEIDPRTGATRHVGAGRPVPDLPPTPAHDTGYANGASLLLRTDLLDLLGFIPEDYFLYFEEADYALRAKEAGFRVLVEPRSVVRHARRSWDAIPSSAYLYYMVRNREIFSRCWGFDAEQAHRPVTNLFVTQWREKVNRARPDLVAVFDAVAEQAMADGEAGVVGYSDVPARLPLG
jgi:GT2 family glycosyltransferase